MKMTITILSGIVFTGFLIVSVISAEITSENYRSLLKELQQKVDEADKKMVAHPTFLIELRGLIDKYRAKIRMIFFSDDFSEGNFTQNPVWYVKSGQFTDDSEGRLRTETITARPMEITEKTRFPGKTASSLSIRMKTRMKTTN